MRRKSVLFHAVEALETRRLLATITVNSTADTVTPNDGAVTLREAITAINAGNDLGDPNITAQNPAATNAFGTKDTIDFNISGSGVHTIQPTTGELPAITVPVTIDGYSQPGSSVANSTTAATIEVEIDGSNAPRYSVGLDVQAQNVTIDGLMIDRFIGSASGIGINLEAGSGNDSIWGNYIGTDGASDTIGNDTGIVIQLGSSNNTIGGTTIDKRNVISGNTLGPGIEMFRDPTVPLDVTGNVIEGNYIGPDATGTKALGNNSGIAMSRTNENTIGGTTPGARNVISGNNGDGIGLNYSADNTLVEGNYIGTTADGLTALPNTEDGIDVSVARGTTIGTAVAGGGNVISGNGSATADSGYGIRVDGGPPATIVNNFIGTDATGTVAIGNKADGILMVSEDAIIGGTAANTRNVISGNVNGIELTGDDNVVEGNYIGTDVTGTKALGNTGAGVVIDNGAQDSTIGGTDAGAGNLISGNGAFGVAINGTGDDSTENSNRDTVGNVVQGNLIGTDVTGENALGDGNAGVYIDDSAVDNTIGGTDSGARNIISGIGGAGVYISGIDIDFTEGAPGPDRTNSNTVEGNYIGTDITGTKPITYPPSSGGQMFSYSGIGIYLDKGTYNNIIGGLTAAARNVISGNLASGVVLQTASTNTVEGNYVGIDASGLKQLGNGVYGVSIIDGSYGNMIGGTSAGARNVISANAGDGVNIGGSSNNVVQGNIMGLFADSITAAGNGGSGVHIGGICQNNIVGGTTAAAGNVIAENVVDGVEVSSGNGAGDAPSDNTIQRNSIYDNGGLGIDLDNFDEDTREGGVSPNDLGDADLGPNDYQNFPVIAGANSNATSVTVNGSFNSLPNTIFTLDFYASDSVDPSGFGEGKQWIGALAVLTDANGNAVFSGTFNAVIGSNKYISSTATNVSAAPYGDTSEFSQSVEATDTSVPPPPPPTAPTLSISDVSMNEGNSGTTNFTFTITRSGDLSGASSVQYSTTDGTATVADNDYKAQSNTIGFDPGQATKTVTILVNGDSKFESDETFTVNLSNATGATIADASATGTILNDDVLPPPTLSINDVSHTEQNSGTHTYTFTVTRSGDTSGTSDVYYSTSDGTATAGSDYVAIPSTKLHFAANQTTATIVVTEKGDTTYESDETFFVNLSNPTNATITNGTGTGTIVNDDAAPPPPPASGSAEVITDPCDSTKTALEIDGTDGKDTITVTKSGSSQGKAVVKINGVTKGTFSFTGSIVVYGKGGADNISIDSGITRSAYIWGGDGNDTVNGGGGNDIIFGQGNDDSLNGNSGRDILVGGDGTDKLNGGSGDDLLIAGDFKSAPSMSQLCSIQKEWDRTDKNYATRVKDLTNGGGYNTMKLNNTTLFSSTTLKDSMTGGSDSDLFFAAMSGDKITDKAPSETTVNIG